MKYRYKYFWKVLSIKQKRFSSLSILWSVFLETEPDFNREYLTKDQFFLFFFFFSMTTEGFYFFNITSGSLTCVALVSYFIYSHILGELF